MLLSLTVFFLVAVEISSYAFSSLLSVRRSSRSLLVGDSASSLARIGHSRSGSASDRVGVGNSNHGRRYRTYLTAAAKSARKGDRRASGSGGGGGGFGASAAAAPMASSTKSTSSYQKKEATARRLQQVYGGTSPQDIAAGTQRRVETAFQNLPSHLKVATTLYQQVTLWDMRMSQLSLLQRSQRCVAQAQTAS